ncbi:uncharacterized protein LY79DRAFT_673350 [Colletotrichum navitas]|uniref:DUF7728 domain-containing protein n=1 Tax=Colletotrichum navitas TaxID=681940 RepID=A0AAD8UZL9_9PEZI|nr:uncharacterized protein LY79DRAFT_673350 [Colletotrichum navitas]KAK1573792.1 hypothetical protein LY79DRAFT_673350 [Colletotrichum navitas]
MLLKSLAAASLAIKATQAFVVVPEISQADSEIVNTLPFELEQPSTEMGLASHRVKVDCPGCPLAMRHYDGRYHTMANINNHLELTFSIDTDTLGVDHLLVNDFELYPKPASWYKALRAPQIPDFTEAATKHPRKASPNTPQLGYSLGVRHVAKDTEQQLELVEIELQIIEVGNSFVSDIPNVSVKLIKSPTGNLMIANIEQTETSVPSRQEEEQEEVEEHVEAPAEDCTTFYCKWRAAILNKMHRMKHCGGRKNHGAMHGQHRHGHHNGQVRHHHHTWAQLAKNVASHILFPVLIGIVAGVSVSIIGMMVGTFVVCLWRVFVRRQPPFARRHCRRRARKSVHREAAAVEEKSGLMAEAEDLPPYKDNDEEDASKVETAQV